MKRAIAKALAAVEALEVEARGMLRTLQSILTPPRRRRSRSRGMRRPWTEAEIRAVRRRFARELTRVIAQDLGRSVSAVYGQAHKMGVAKDPAFVQETNRQLGAALGQRPAAKAHQFQAGRAGGFHSEKQKRAFLEAGKRTRFQAGRKPLNTWRPIGTETVSKEGFLLRKVTDKGGYNNDDWKPVHHIVWEKAGRTIPPGHVLIFKDGNRRNFRLRNLKLLTLAENMRRNTIHRYPVEIKKTIRALAKLKRVIRRKEDEKQD